jgi:type III restriction enzyme
MAKQTTIDRLVINNPYEEPRRYWDYDRTSRSMILRDGRRPAGYVVASEHSRTFDDPGTFVEIPLVNRIRARVRDWREADYPNATGITKRLLEHWYDPQQREGKRLFFCQLEAIETIIWLTEAADSEKVGLDIPSDGGPFTRLCSKMATGSGKTVVMAMLVAWQIINKVTYPQDTRFARNIFAVAPGLTVRSRLQVLIPSTPGNYYDEFNVVPPGLLEKLRQGRVLIRNWHALQWDTEESLARKKSVDKRGVMSDEAYAREVLGEMSNAKSIIVINDEAHHAWRIPEGSEVKGLSKQYTEMATVWISGLDRIHAARKILRCYDFTATPFVPTGKKSTEENLYGWIMSDFGLNDAIESGLVKTPRVVIRDDGVPDAKTYRSKLYHIYVEPDVKDDLNRRADENEPLPDLVLNAYYLLGKDWLETYKKWKKVGHRTPPVMISVANRTHTAARLKYAFDHKKVRIAELCDAEKILHIDSQVLDKAEAEDEPITQSEEIDEDENEDQPSRRLSKKEQAEALRLEVDTVGKLGRPGEQIRNVISVGMLSEGWDAKTVTHIMGLRAFTSQLLCEQVVGRGLRRTSYETDKTTGLFDPEYVNIFGVPFTFLPHESYDGPPPPPPAPKSRIEPLLEKKEHEISWPNVLRIDHSYRSRLEVDIGTLKVLELNAKETLTRADVAPIIEGKPDISMMTEIDLRDLENRFRLQHIIFLTAAEVFEQMKPDWRANKDNLLVQLIKLVEAFLNSDRVKIVPSAVERDEIRRRIILALNMKRIVEHLWQAIRFESSESIEPIFDKDNPIRSTADMLPWYTGRPCEHTKKSHINMCVFDSAWEASEASELDHNPNVDSWVKNDHLGFEILYIHGGVVRKYYPDFIVRLKNESFLILETKGQDTDIDKAKREFLDEWVRAVNSHGGFGRWQWDVSRDPADVSSIIAAALK